MQIFTNAHYHLNCTRLFFGARIPDSAAEIRLVWGLRSETILIIGGGGRGRSIKDVEIFDPGRNELAERVPTVSIVGPWAVYFSILIGLGFGHTISDY